MSETSAAKLVICEARDAPVVRRSESTFKYLVVCCDVCAVWPLSTDWGNGPVLTLVKLLSAGIQSL